MHQAGGVSRRLLPLQPVTLTVLATPPPVITAVDSWFYLQPSIGQKPGGQPNRIDPIGPTPQNGCVDGTWPSRSRRTENNCKAQPEQRSGIRTVPWSPGSARRRAIRLDFPDFERRFRLSVGNCPSATGYPSMKDEILRHFNAVAWRTYGDRCRIGSALMANMAWSPDQTSSVLTSP